MADEVILAPIATECAGETLARVGRALNWTGNYFFPAVCKLLELGCTVRACSANRLVIETPPLSGTRVRRMARILRAALNLANYDDYLPAVKLLPGGSDTASRIIVVVPLADDGGPNLRLLNVE